MWGGEHRIPHASAPLIDGAKPCVPLRGASSTKFAYRPARAPPILSALATPARATLQLPLAAEGLIRVLMGTKSRVGTRRYVHLDGMWTRVDRGGVD